MPRFLGILFLLCFASPAFAEILIPVETPGAGVVAAATAVKRKLALTLVFCSRHYSDQVEFRKDVEFLDARIRAMPPFDLAGTVRSFYMEAPADKKVVSPSKAYPYVQIDPGLLKRIGRQLGAPFKFVLLDREDNTAAGQLSDIRQTSSIVFGRRIASDERKLARIFIHEVGHSLGLREENRNSTQGIEPGYPNCAISEAQAKEWWGDIADKENGVGFYPFESHGRILYKPMFHSIMDDPARFKDLGPVNERYLRAEFADTGK